MLAGIIYRIEHAGAQLNPTARPPGYRSERLRKRLKEMGATKTTLWGPTAIRGDLASDKKNHIIEFLKLVNELPRDPDTLVEAFNRCAALYVQKTKQEYPPIVLPEESSIQCGLSSALRHGGEGKIQQGLIYALLEVERQLTHADYQVQTKRTHAGDQQSRQKADVQVVKGGQTLSAYEVKGMPLTPAEMERVLGTHGKHSYPLFILAPDYVPAEIKRALNSLENTFAVNLEDFLVTRLSVIISQTSIPPQDLLWSILDTYNNEFCRRIENDPSIVIVVRSGQTRA